MNKVNKSYEISNVTNVEKNYAAIVSTFTVKDSQGDRIEFGAFKKSIERLKNRGGSVPVLFQHSNDLRTVIGKTTFIEELAPGDSRLPERVQALGGLYVEFEFYNEFEEGKKAEKLLNDKVYQEFSVGMYLLEYEVINDDYMNYEAIIKEADLVEYSLVLRGANVFTELISVKDLMQKEGKTKKIDVIDEVIEVEDSQKRRTMLMLARTLNKIQGYANGKN